MRLGKSSLKKQKEILDNVSIFLNRGYSIYECFNLLKFRFNLQSYIEDLEEGCLLSEILSKNNYDRDILLVIEIAEKSGNLKLGVEKAHLIIKQKIENKNQVLELIKYPLLLAVILILALGFVSLFLIPQFQKIYDSFGMELSIGIKLIFIGIRSLPIVILLIAIAIILFIIYLKAVTYEKRIQILIKNKYIKKYYLKIYNQIFVINIHNLLMMGLRIDEILVILKQQDYNKLLKVESVRILNELSEGKLLYETIQNEFYSNELILIIKDGETYSTLVHSLENYTIFIEKTNQDQAKKLIFMIQPVFYGIFGILIIILYTSIFVPMFQMMETI